MLTRWPLIQLCSFFLETVIHCSIGGAPALLRFLSWAPQWRRWVNVAPGSSCCTRGSAPLLREFVNYLTPLVAAGKLDWDMQHLLFRIVAVRQTRHPAEETHFDHLILPLTTHCCPDVSLSQLHNRMLVYWPRRRSALSIPFYFRLFSKVDIYLSPCIARRGRSLQNWLCRLSHQRFPVHRTCLLGAPAVDTSCSTLGFCDQQGIYAMLFGVIILNLPSISHPVSVKHLRSGRRDQSFLNRPQVWDLTWACPFSLFLHCIIRIWN